MHISQTALVLAFIQNVLVIHSEGSVLILHTHENRDLPCWRISTKKMWVIKFRTVHKADNKCFWMPSYDHLTLFSRKPGLVRCYSCLFLFCEFTNMFILTHYMTSYGKILKVVLLGKLWIDWQRCKHIVRTGRTGKEADG